MFMLLDGIDKDIIGNYIEGNSVRTIARKLHLSPTFVFERIYQFEIKIEKNIRLKKQ